MAGLVGGTVAKSPQSMTHCRVLQERPEILVVGLCLWQIPNLHIIIHICSHIHYDCFNVEPFFGGLMNSMEVIFRQMVVSFTLLLLGGLDLHILQHGDSNLWNDFKFLYRRKTHMGWSCLATSYRPLAQSLPHRIHVCYMYIYIYMVTFTINIPQMLAYIPYMDPMGSTKIVTIFCDSSNFDPYPDWSPP